MLVYFAFMKDSASSSTLTYELEADGLLSYTSSSLSVNDAEHMDQRMAI